MKEDQGISEPFEIAVSAIHWIAKPFWGGEPDFIDEKGFLEYSSLFFLERININLESRVEEWC